LRAAANPALTEDLALSILKRVEITSRCPGAALQEQQCAQIAQGQARAGEPSACRRGSVVPLIRQFYTFDLMKSRLTPAVPAAVKVAADDLLISR